MSITGVCKVGVGSSITNLPCGDGDGFQSVDEDKINFLAYNGVTEAPIISATSGATTFDVAAGTVKFYDYSAVSSGGSPVETVLTFAGTTGIAGTQFDGVILTTFVSITKVGTIIQRQRETNAVEGLTEVLLGNFDHSFPALLTFNGTTIVPHTSYGVDEAFRQYIRSRGGISMFGLDVLATTAANLEILNTSGIGLRMGGGYNVDSNNPNMPTAPAADPSTFIRVYIDGSGALIPLPGQTLLDPDNYSLNGVLTNVMNNNYTVQRVFFFYTSNTMFVYYGTEQFNTLSEAIGAILTEDFIEHPSSFGAAPVGFIIGKQSATDNNVAADYEFRKGLGIRSAAQFGGGSISTPVAGSENFRATRITTDQLIPSSTNTTIIFNSTVEDPGSNFTAAPAGTIYTVPTNGVYAFTASLDFDNLSMGGDMCIVFLINGVETCITWAHPPFTANNTGGSITFTGTLATLDTVSVRTNLGGFSANLQANNRTHFSGMRLS